MAIIPGHNYVTTQLDLFLVNFAEISLLLFKNKYAHLFIGSKSINLSQCFYLNSQYFVRHTTTQVILKFKQGMTYGQHAHRQHRQHIILFKFVISSQTVHIKRIQPILHLKEVCSLMCTCTLKLQECVI